MNSIDENLELTCGVCFEKGIFKLLKLHSCFTSVEGMQCIMLHEAQGSIYPASDDGKSVLVMSTQTGSPLPVLWSELLELLNNRTMPQQQQQQQQSSQAHSSTPNNDNIQQQQLRQANGSTSSNNIQQQQQSSEAATFGSALSKKNMQQHQQQQLSQAAGFSGGISSNNNKQQQQRKSSQVAGFSGGISSNNNKQQQQQRKSSQVAGFSGGISSNNNKQQQQRKSSQVAGFSGGISSNNNKQQQQQRKSSQVAGFSGGISSNNNNNNNNIQQQQQKKSNLSILLDDDYNNNDEFSDNFSTSFLENPSEDILEDDLTDNVSSHQNPRDHFDENEMLIMSVQSRPPLWDYRLDPAARSVVAKQKLWEEIVNTPGIKGKFTVDTAKARWKNLIDHYRKTVQEEQYRIKKSGSAAITKKAKWIYYDIMSFAQDRCLITKTISNRDSGISTNENSDEENVENMRSNANKRRRSKNQEDGDSSASALMLIAEKLSAPEPQLPPMPEQDDVDFSLAVVGSNCRQLPPSERTAFLRELVLKSFDVVITYRNNTQK